MFVRRLAWIGTRLWWLGVPLAAVLYSEPAPAAPRARAGTKAALQTPRAKASPSPPPSSAAPAAAAPAATGAPAPAAPRPAAEVRVEDADKDEAKAAVIDTDEQAGVKTYTFGAQEVEGRLRSPQILYFLRRVRAEFDSAPLGHRSFLLELSDTRRHPALK